MRFQLLMYLDPAIWDSLTEAQQTAIFAGHEAFHDKLATTGELISTLAVAGPDESVTVRVRGHHTTIEPGLLQNGAALFCGHYVVECEDQRRACELAALIPDAAYTAVEVRQIIHEADFSS